MTKDYIPGVHVYYIVLITILVHTSVRGAYTVFTEKHCLLTVRDLETLGW
jgi:hypothetical protein